MFEFSILIETLISLVVVYILFSIINSVLIEAFARWFKTRAVFLKNTLYNLFESDKPPATSVPAAFSFAPQLLVDPKPQLSKADSIIHKAVQEADNTSFVDSVYNHPLLTKLSVFDKGKISSIDKGLFADIVISLLTHDEEIRSKEDLRSRIEGSKLSPGMKNIFKQVVLRIEDEKGAIFDQFRSLISKWYEFYMQKATESYKHHIRKFLFVGGLMIAAFMNLDSIFLAQWFYQNPEARDTYVSLGRQLDKDSIEVDHVKLTEYLMTHRDSLDGNAMLSYLLSISKGKQDSTIVHDVLSPIPIGPGKLCVRPGLMNSKSCLTLTKVLGILITALALSFGSPFWFEFLRKVIKIKDQLNATTN